MTLVVDTAPIVALADRGDPRRDAVLATLRDEPGDLVLPAPVTAEIDYLLGVRFGRPARLAFLRDLAERRYEVACLGPIDHARVAELEDRYSELNLGLADSAMIVVADRLQTDRILTFDHRHARAVMTMAGEPFVVLPADAG